MNSKNINVPIISCKENYYKTLVIVKRKKKKMHQKALKRKIQIQQKTLKTLLLIKIINGKTSKNCGPHKSLEP